MSYGNDTLGLALNDVIETIRRKPTETEIALIIASSLLGLSLYQYGSVDNLPPNKVGRASAMIIFRSITLNYDNSKNSITDFYRKSLAYSQRDLDEQMRKAIEKSSNDIVYDSSTIRAMIIGTRKYLYKSIGLDAREFLLPDSLKEAAVLKIIKELKLQADFLLGKNQADNAYRLFLFYHQYMLEVDNEEANAFIMIG